MAGSDAMLISIRPEFADRIFAGKKTVELRRTRPRVLSGDLILIYVTSPVKALMGICEVEQVITGTPEALWEELQDQAGMSAEEFESYYDGAELGVGICFRSAYRLATPLHLEVLRAKWPRFHPPQSYHYLSPDQVSLVGAGHRDESAGIIAQVLGES